MQFWIEFWIEYRIEFGDNTLKAAKRLSLFKHRQVKNAENMLLWLKQRRWRFGDPEAFTGGEGVSEPGRNGTRRRG